MSEGERASLDAPGAGVSEGLRGAPPAPVPMQILELHAGALRAALRVDLGGSLAGLWIHGHPMLHGCEPAAMVSVDDGACFPCAPFTQALGRATLRWMDTTHVLTPGTEPGAARPGRSHAVDGVAWRRPWEVVAVTARAAEIRYRHAADGAWPFAFEARQVVELRGRSLLLQLSLTNEQAAPQPAGIGWQVAFPRRPGTRIDFRCRERWNLDAHTRLPRDKVVIPRVSGEVDTLVLDHAYEGWSGALRMRSDAGTVRLRASLDRLAVSTSEREGRLRAGPASHAPDAFHMSSPTANGLEVLPPGASMEAWMRVVVAR